MEYEYLVLFPASGTKRRSKTFNYDEWVTSLRDVVKLYDVDMKAAYGTLAEAIPIAADELSDRSWMVNRYCRGNTGANKFKAEKMVGICLLGETVVGYITVVTKGDDRRVDELFVHPDLPPQFPLLLAFLTFT